MKKVYAVIIAVSMFLSFTTANAKPRDEKSDFLKSQSVVTEKADVANEAPAPAQNTENAPAGTPSAPSMPEPDNGAPVEETPGDTQSATSNYYCVIPNDSIKSMEALCLKYNAPMSVYRAFNQLVVLKRLGVIVNVNPKDTYFISKLRKEYNAKPLRKVMLKAKIHVKSLTYSVDLTEAREIKSDFKTNDASLGEMIKNPYGHNSSMFKSLAKQFPGMLDKVTVKAKDLWGFGKKRKLLFNPVVTLELVALNMNGKDKNVTIYFQEFAFDTIKHDDSYQW